MGPEYLIYWRTCACLLNLEFKKERNVIKKKEIDEHCRLILNGGAVCKLLQNCKIWL